MRVQRRRWRRGESMNILIKNGRVIDPATKTDKISDLYIEAGKIKEIKDEITHQNR